MVSRMPMGWLTLCARHEFREGDAEAGPRSVRAAEHGRELHVRVPARGGDVQVRPRFPAGELADEHASQYGPRLAVFRVAQVRDLAAKEDAVVGVDRQAPDSISRLDGGSLDLRPELVVVADRRGS